MTNIEYIYIYVHTGCLVKWIVAILGEWIKENKKFLYHFEVLAIVFELEKKMSKLNIRLSRAARIRRTITFELQPRRCAGRGKKRLTYVSLAWRFYVSRRIAPTLSKNVILAAIFLTLLSYHYKSCYLARLNTF